jgi:hypothetical protein
MTFDGLHAAPILDTVAFVPVAAALASDDGAGTLDAALRAAAPADAVRAEARADAGVLDLWLGKTGGDAVHVLDHLGASRLALALSTVAADDGGDRPLFAAFGDEDDGDGGQEVTVTGHRPRSADDDGGDIGGGYGDGGYPGGTDGGGGSPPPNQDPNDCRDRGALHAKDAINSQPDDQSREYASVIYRGTDGGVHNSVPIRGSGAEVTRTEILLWMHDNNVELSQFIGLVHNHDLAQYGTSDAEALVNRYPSMADWDFAEWAVGAGAGGSAGGGGFAMYIIDTKGNLREFDFADMAAYRGMDQPHKERGSNLPTPKRDDGTSC